jgi:tripartite-type tricarboxylate transporter receptor subunit TctC
MLCRHSRERVLSDLHRLLALLLLCAVAVALAQDNYPSRPITLIVPYAAGGSIDLVARILAEG